MDRIVVKLFASSLYAATLVLLLSSNDRLAHAARFVRELPEPRLFVGDLNTTLFSPYYADFIAASNLTDARRGAGLLPTFPARSLLGALTRLPIDHCFVGEGVRVRGIKAGGDFGSDHLPLIVNLEVDRK